MRALLIILAGAIMVGCPAPGSLGDDDDDLISVTNDDDSTDDVADDDDLVAAVQKLRAVRRQLEGRRLTSFGQREGRVDVLEAHRE